MRRLLHICVMYAATHNMHYNTEKSVCMLFKSKNTPSCMPPLYLNGQTLQRVEEVKYLGHIIISDLCDVKDMERQRRALSVKGNMLGRRFQRCINLSNGCSLPPTAPTYIPRSYGTIIPSERITKSAFSIAWRALHRLSRWCSASEMFAAGRVPAWAALLRRTAAGAEARVFASTNTVVCAARRWLASPIHAEWRRLHCVGGR
ncbi:uncharacterized protein LOC126381306 [Pectinophora gossypiella]|uniref:uncharacterized protein LOC126381306 n=1 Tax=Pectinophora gossypiella TaxID=13191 RepID=UPI00214E6988|nr:uncharacterized protein LOC126381306 [Pectinophora gossypiella]